MIKLIEEVYALYEKIASNELVEENMNYHKEIADALKNDYDLAFGVFSCCSVEFFQWFSKNNLPEITSIILHHKKKELLLILQSHLLELVGGNYFDPRIDDIGAIYHATYRLLS